MKPARAPARSGAGTKRPALSAAVALAACLEAAWLAGEQARAGGNLEARIDNNTRIADSAWVSRALPITWKINSQGAIQNCDDGNPTCVDGVSPLTLQRVIDAMTAGFNAWQAIPGSTITFSFAGTTSQTNIGLDNVRLISWADTTPGRCGTGVVATTPSSRLAVMLTVTDAIRDLNADGIIDLDPAIYPNGTVLPPGTIVDADMAWCPATNDYTDTPVNHVFTFDIVAIGTHEIGHFHGLAHSPLIAPIATMLPFVEGTVEYQNDIRALALDDIVASSRYYPDPAGGSTFGSIRGRLLLPDLVTGADGVSVTAIDIHTGEQAIETISVSRFTSGPELPGSFRLERLPPGDYLVGVEYFDGTSGGGFDPWWDNNRYNNTVINSNVSGGQNLPLVARPEFWNSSDTATDDLAAPEVVTVAAGETRDLGTMVINVPAPPPPPGAAPLHMGNGEIVQVGFPAGFTFPFYGQSYGSAFVSDNFNVAFGFAPSTSSHTGNFLGPNPVGGDAVPPRIGLPMTNVDPGIDDRGQSGEALEVFAQHLDDAAGERMEITFLGVPVLDLEGPTLKSNTVILRLFRGGRVEIEPRFVSTWWGIIGLSPGAGQNSTAPGVELDISQDLTGPFSGGAGQAIYEHFEFAQREEVGGRNLLRDAFDLNGTLLVFTPNAAGGYDLSSPAFTVSRPGEILNLRFVNPTGLEWDARPEAVSYNLYRGDIASLVDADADGVAEAYGACAQGELTTASATDIDVPGDDQGFFYLATAVNSDGQSPFGAASNGLPIPAPAPCP